MARDYARIATRIKEANWLITEPGLELILEIFDRRLAGEKLTDEEIAIRLEEVGAHGNGDAPYKVENGIATLGIYGPIFGKANMMTQLSGATSMEAFRKDFQTAVADPQVEAIVLDIDSPGGSSEMIAEAGDEIFAARDIKPVHAIANSMAGSAAYWLGSQATKLHMTPSGSVGSIGAYTVHKDQSKADDQQGTKYTFVSAGRYKTEGNPHEPLSKEGRDYRQEVINEVYGDFLNVVARGRGTTAEKVEADYGGGRMYDSRRASEAGMVDSVVEYDSLISSLAAPRSVHVVMPGMGGATAQAVLGVGGVYHLESAEWEHSEPGTGSPPAPRLPEHTDKAIESGSRRPDITPGLPNENDEPGAPKAMNEETFTRLCSLLGVTTDEELITSVTEMQATVNALDSDVNRAGKFAEMFPEEHARLQRSQTREREHDATEFVRSVAQFTRPEGDKKVNAGIGLSALAQQTLKDTYIKLAASGGTVLADFENAIRSITQAGTVKFGENGSSRVDETVEFNDNTPNGVADMRQLFSKKVSEIMLEDKLEMKEALAEAGRRYPDLAAAYRTTLPA